MPRVPEFLLLAPSTGLELGPILPVPVSDLPGGAAGALIGHLRAGGLVEVDVEERQVSADLGDKGVSAGVASGWRVAASALTVPPAAIERVAGLFALPGHEARLRDAALVLAAAYGADVDVVLGALKAGVVRLQPAVSLTMGTAVGEDPVPAGRGGLRLV